MTPEQVRSVYDPEDIAVDGPGDQNPDMFYRDAKKPAANKDRVKDSDSARSRDRKANVGKAVLDPEPLAKPRSLKGDDKAAKPEKGRSKDLDAAVGKKKPAA